MAHPPGFHPRLAFKAIMENEENKRDFGLQPLDSMMRELGLENHALVAVSTEQLTHKMVSKGRQGRYLSTRVRLKILRAFNKAGKLNKSLSDLFNYR